MRKITIGRASDNTIVFSSPTISGHHADVLVFDDGRVVYTDHSSNGTWVNGSRLHNESYEIRENDRIILPGNVLLDWSMLHIRTPKTHFETYNSNSGGVKQGYSHQYAGQIKKNRPKTKKPLKFFLYRLNFILLPFTVGFVMHFIERGTDSDGITSSEAWIMYSAWGFLIVNTSLFIFNRKWQKLIDHWLP